MFQNVTKITNPIATGAGYAILPLVLASSVDALMHTHLAAYFENVSYRTILAFATLYCLAMAVTISTRNRKQRKFDHKIHSLAVDRLTSFLGLCLAIGGLPAYTRNTIVPLYVAVCFFALIAVSFAVAMWSIDKLEKEQSETKLHLISLVFLVLACLLGIVTLTIG